jgi:hypothetical protein
MDLMTKLLQFPWGLAATSGIVSLLCGAAILSLGAPPAILILAMWATATVYIAMKPRINRRLGQR